MTAAALPIPTFPAARPPARRVPRGDALSLTPDGATSADSRELERARERELVREAQEGSDDAFAALVRMHQRRAYVVARSIVLSHEDAEDAVQEAFLHAHKALGRFLPEQSFGAWLYRIVSNAALDLVRRRKVRETDELPETVALPFRDPGEAGELRARLARALRRLQPRQRAVIVMHDVEGFTHVEIGGVLGIPEGTARSDLHHARAALRGLLRDLWSDG